MKKIAIIGSSGFVGGELTERFKKENNYSVIQTHYKNPTKKSSIYLNAVNLQMVNKFCIQNRPSIIILASGYKNIPECEQNRKKAYSVNVTPIKNFITAVKKQDYISKIFYISSDYVFPGTKGNYSENDKPKPTTYYGKVKHEAEKLINKSKDKRFFIIRSSSIIGIRSSFVNDVLKNLNLNKKVFLYDNLFISPTPAELLFLGIKSLIKQPKLSRNLYHICGNTIMSRYRLGIQVAKAVNLPVNKILPQKANSRVFLPHNTSLIPSSVMDKFSKKSLFYYLKKSLNN